MDVEEAQAAAFRIEARAWLARHAPPKGSPEDFSVRRVGLAPGEREQEDARWVDRCRAWQRTVHDGGWAGITWPIKYGGRGGTAIEDVIFADEQSRFGVTTAAFNVAIGMAGPTLLAHGTEAQRDRYLPRMLRGEDVWCQLFSEPSAGSDLAALRTTAVRADDGWVVDGQKVWTSGARLSDHAVLLARTDLAAPKHQGLTYFLVDMRAPGIEIRPLRQMSGEHRFNEVFLTGLVVPEDDVVGDVGDGWRIARSTLTNERHLIGSRSVTTVRELVDLARGTGVIIGPPSIRQRLARLHAREQALRYLGLRARAAIGRGRPPGPEVSVLKLAAGQLRTDISEVALEILGADGMLVGAAAPVGGVWQHEFLENRGARIGGGTDEVQRNVLAERILGLPREPGPR